MSLACCGTLSLIHVVLRQCCCTVHPNASGDVHVRDRKQILAMNSNTVVTAPKTADCNPNRVTKDLKTVGGNVSAANLGMKVHGE